MLLIDLQTKEMAKRYIKNDRKLSNFYLIALKQQFKQIFLKYNMSYCHKKYQQISFLIQFLFFSFYINQSMTPAIPIQYDLKENAEKIIQILLTKYSINKKIDCLQQLLEGNFQDALLYVPKSKRDQFSQQIRNCKELHSYLNQRLKRSAEEIPKQISPRNILQQAIKAVKKKQREYITLSIQQRKQYFNEAFNKYLSKIQMINKLYAELLQAREDLLRFFLSATSDHVIQISEGQTERFLNHILGFCKRIIQDHKIKINQNQAKTFKKQYPRSIIQNKIDNQCFSSTSRPQDWMNYLSNPGKVIQQKYNSLIKFSASNIGEQYKQCKKVRDLVKQFRQIMCLLLQKLQSEGITQDMIHTNIVSIVKKTQKYIQINDNEVLEKVNVLMMQFLLDLITNDEKKVYTEVDFNIQVNQNSRNLKLKRQPTELFKSLIRQFKDQKQSITGFYTFVEMINAKLDQKILINNVLVSKFDNQISMMLEATENDKKSFTSLVSVKICKEVCPGCQRICGVEQAHINNHECKYGHQMRALSGVMLSNHDASVIRCEDVDLMSQISYNGKKMTWKQFKEYWETKPYGSWSFADLKANKNKELFYKAWDLTGQAICKKYKMNYVKSNALETQKLMTTPNPVHYIFVLDDSGSMSGRKWKDLMTSYNTAIQTIKKLPGSQLMIKISVLIQGSTCIQFQQNVTPSAVNLNVKYRSGGNNFADTFEKAYNLMVKYYTEAKIKYIFMTDGGDSYPSSQVAKIKKLKNQNPGKIEYYGIEFQTSGETMKLINSQLQGKNTISHNVNQLTSAYLQIINRII